MDSHPSPSLLPLSLPSTLATRPPRFLRPLPPPSPRPTFLAYQAVLFLNHIPALRNSDSHSIPPRSHSIFGHQRNFKPSMHSYLPLAGTLLAFPGNRCTSLITTTRTRNLIPLHVSISTIPSPRKPGSTRTHSHNLVFLPCPALLLHMTPNPHTLRAFMGPSTHTRTAQIYPPSIAISMI